MARKDDSPAISLFSFQDIITSLTGIMFLVVLLLVLCMMDMHKREDPAQRTETQQVAEAASKRIAELKKQLAQLKKAEQQYQHRIQELRKLDLDTIWLRLEKLRRDFRLQQLANRKLKEERTTLKQTLEQLLLQLKEVQQESVEQDRANIELAQKLKQLQEEFKKRHAQTVKIKQAMKYVVENDTSFSPVLVECTPTGVKIMDCSNGQETDLRIANSTFEARRQKFLEWVKTRGRNDEYYTILLKPGSVVYEELLYDLKDLQKNRGMEILPADDVSLWGEK